MDDREYNTALEAARSTDARVRLAIVAVVGIGLLLVCLVIVRLSNSSASDPAPIVNVPDEVPKTTAANLPHAKMPVANPPVPAPDPAASAAAAHHQRLAALRQKREAAELAIAIEHETIKEVLEKDGIEAIPDNEHERVERLVQEKESIDAAIKEEEEEGGVEPPPPTVVQTLPHHQVGETFSIGYWTYVCSTAQWSGGSSSATAVRRWSEPDAAFAIIHLKLRNDDDSASMIPSVSLVDSTGHEYKPSPKAVLQRDALDLDARLDAKGSLDGSVVFERSKRKARILLRVSGGMMSDKSAPNRLSTPRHDSPMRTTDAVAMLKEHRKNLASELSRIDAALTALKRPGHKMSLSVRRRMAAAQRARWAKRRKG